MKEEKNNEMDLLLRRLGRRPDISVSAGNGDVEHLDADELSAYAENVLPAAARARYTAHLAECSRCREIVVQLSSSAGVVPATVKAPEPSALRKFLASLFSPLVMRYAVPALGLIVVAAIGVFVLQKKQRGTDSVAQVTEAPAVRPLVNTQEAEPTSQANQQTRQQQPPAKPAHPSGSPENQVAAAARAEPPPPAPAPGEFGANPKSEQPAAAETVTIVEPKPATDAREQQAKVESRDEAARSRSANGPPAEKEKSADAVTVEDRKKTEETPSQPAISTTSSSVGGLANLKPGIAAAAQKKRDDAADKDKKEAPTKTVAGRRFRKQDGVWVDTAYDSVRNPVNLTRGSQQYRALIADEPEIKKIAEQLDGEIIVVWKGHTYRIR